MQDDMNNSLWSIYFLGVLFNQWPVAKVVPISQEIHFPGDLVIDGSGMRLTNTENNYWIFLYFTVSQQVWFAVHRSKEAIVKIWLELWVVKTTTTWILEQFKSRSNDNAIIAIWNP